MPKNHPYCPTLKHKISGSKVSEGVKSIPEIVINGVSLDVVKEAMNAAMDSVRDVEGLVKISAGNYGGKLGKYRVFLRDMEGMSIASLCPPVARNEL